MNVRHCADLHSHFNNPKLSDLVIILADRRLHVHKLVLVLSSDFFRAALAGGFKVYHVLLPEISGENNQRCLQEDGAHTLSLPDDDAEATEAMLRHFYGLAPHTAAKDPGIIFDLRLFAVAGKYDVPALLDEAVKRVREYLEPRWQHKTFPQLVFEIYEGVPAHGGVGFEEGA